MVPDSGSKRPLTELWILACASRDIKSKEKTKLGDHQEFLVSKDCLALAVHKDNPMAEAGQPDQSGRGPDLQW